MRGLLQQLASGPGGLLLSVRDLTLCESVSRWVVPPSSVGYLDYYHQSEPKQLILFHHQTLRKSFEAGSQHLSKRLCLIVSGEILSSH